MRTSIARTLLSTLSLVTLALVAGAVPTASAAGSSSSPKRVCAAVTAGHARCLAEVDTSAVTVAPTTAAGTTAAGTTAAGTKAAVTAPSFGLSPASIASVYQLDQSRGATQTVAVIDAYSNPNAAADLAAYRAAWKLPACTTASGCFRQVSQRGTSTLPKADAGWGLEIALDLDAVSAACPKCKILLVEADTDSWDNLGAAVNRAVTMGATVVSNSYGGDESTGMTALGSAYYSHPGVAMVASSGDSGYGKASFPAIWPNVIAVGGTSLTHSGSTWTEKAWSGAGSGCSTLVARPSYQSGTSCAKKLSSDLSAVADPNTGLAVYDTYGQKGWLLVGGTSLSAPLVAAMIALAGNARTMTSAAYIYAHRSGLHDITSGSNGSCGGTSSCTSKTGYDGPTGAGSPRGLTAL